MNGQTWVTLEDGRKVVLLTALRTMRKWRYNNEWWDGSRIVYAKGSAGWETMSVHEAVAKGEGVEFYATHAEMVCANAVKMRERKDPADHPAKQADAWGVTEEGQERKPFLRCNGDKVADFLHAMNWTTACDIALMLENRHRARRAAQNLTPGPGGVESEEAYIANGDAVADLVGKGVALEPERFRIYRTLRALMGVVREVYRARQARASAGGSQDPTSKYHRRMQAAESEAARWKRRAGVLEADKEQRGRWMRSAAQWLARLREGQHFTVYSAVSTLLASRLQKWGPGVECADPTGFPKIGPGGEWYPDPVDKPKGLYQRRRWSPAAGAWVTETSRDRKVWTSENANMHPLLGGARVEEADGGRYLGNVVDFRQMYPGGGWTVRVRKTVDRFPGWLSPVSLMGTVPMPADLLIGIGRPIGKATGGIIGQEKKGATLSDKELLWLVVGCLAAGIVLGALASAVFVRWVR